MLAQRDRARDVVVAEGSSASSRSPSQAVSASGEASSSSPVSRSNVFTKSSINARSLGAEFGITV